MSDAIKPFEAGYPSSAAVQLARLIVQRTEVCQQDVRNALAMGGLAEAVRLENVWWDDVVQICDQALKHLTDRLQQMTRLEIERKMRTVEPMTFTPEAKERR